MAAHLGRGIVKVVEQREHILVDADERADELQRQEHQRDEHRTRELGGSAWLLLPYLTACTNEASTRTKGGEVGRSSCQAAACGKWRGWG